MPSKEYVEVERPALAALDALGWEVRDATAGEDGYDTRERESTVLLEDRLREALLRINPWLNENNLGKAVRELRNVTAVDTMRANRAIHNKLTAGIAVEQDVGSGKKHQTVHFIDYENPENNDFLAVNQFRVEGEETIIPDIVAFVNGIPLGVLECKSPTLAEPRKQALDQLQRYQNVRGYDHEGAQRLFEYNQFSAGLWYDDAISGTYGTPRGQYKAWKDPYPADDEHLASLFDVPAVTNQHRLLYAQFDPERLLEHLRFFTVFQETGNGAVKMVARYQQYRAVRKAMEAIDKRRTLSSDGGVVWHTQGSGKSLTMLFLGLKLRAEKSNPTLLLVTDRQALDRQIKSTFEQCGFPNPTRAESIEDLRQKLETDAGRTITTLVQKFQERDEEETFPTLTESENVYVMVDEAHRTQYDVLANNMRTALPNAFYVGFTGTPIEKERRDTRRAFGNYIDQYTIDQSIDDGTTERILYQGRLADIHLDGANLDTLFDRVFHDRTDEEKAEIQKRYAQPRHLAESPKRIQQVCLDIVEHFDEQIAPPFKGMVVTTSREAAIEYKKTLDGLGAPESAAVISGDHNDPPKLKQHTPSDEEKKLIKERFNDPNDDLTFLIVCDMLLTGFDAPIAQVMYLDKPLREHTLLQAIARVNRPYEDKNYGLIIDYYGISNDLKEALAVFSQQEVERAMTPLEDEVPKLEAAHRKARSFFDGVDFEDDEACLQALESEDTRIRFNQAFKQFSKLMDIVLPNPKAAPYRADLKRLSDIYHRAKQRYRDESMNLEGCGEKVRDIIREHISSSGIQVLNEEPVSVLDAEEFEAGVSGLDDEAKASEMRHALEYTLRVQYDRDPVFYDSIQERLEELIEAYKDRRFEEQVLIEELRDLIDAVRSRQQEATKLGFDSTTELSFYHALDAEIGESLDEDALVDITHDVVEMLDENRVVDWKEKPNIQKEMRKDLKIYLVKRYPEFDTERRDALATRTIELARAHFD